VADRLVGWLAGWLAAFIDPPGTLTKAACCCHVSECRVVHRCSLRVWTHQHTYAQAGSTGQCMEATSFPTGTSCVEETAAVVSSHDTLHDVAVFLVCCVVFVGMPSQSGCPGILCTSVNVFIHPSGLVQSLGAAGVCGPAWNFCPSILLVVMLSHSWAVRETGRLTARQWLYNDANSNPARVDSSHVCSEPYLVACHTMGWSAGTPRACWCAARSVIPKACWFETGASCSKWCPCLQPLDVSTWPT
jgi:hypothetical protein